jgi:hypothetical protein
VLATRFSCVDNTSMIIQPLSRCLLSLSLERAFPVVKRFPFLVNSRPPIPTQTLLLQSRKRERLPTTTSQTTKPATTYPTTTTTYRRVAFSVIFQSVRHRPLLFRFIFKLKFLCYVTRLGTEVVLSTMTKSTTAAHIFQRQTGCCCGEIFVLCAREFVELVN